LANRVFQSFFMLITVQPGSDFAFLRARAFEPGI